MITIKTYAAIDIGSNAMGLLVSNIVEQEGKDAQFNKSSLVRVPIRLGQDVFTVGEISDENIERMIDAMKAYKLLMKVHKVEHYKACATSAMREADNNRDIVEIIQREADIHIDIIDGKKEAAIIASSDLKEYIATDKTYLYVDVGGGSTEFSLFSNGKIIASKSFKNGTVRMLNNMVNEVVWVEIEKWIKLNTAPFEDITMIGSGGNINKLFKMTGKQQDKPLELGMTLGNIGDLLAKQKKRNEAVAYYLSSAATLEAVGAKKEQSQVLRALGLLYIRQLKWWQAMDAMEKSLTIKPKLGPTDWLLRLMLRFALGVF